MIKIEKFYSSGQLSKIETNEYIKEYHPNGMFKIIIYKNKNNPHIVSRKNGPAKIVYNANGTIHWKSYVYDEYKLFHRVYGPAIQDYNDCENQWVYENKEYSTKVEKWLKENNMNWEKMNKEDFDRMWFEII